VYPFYDATKTRKGNFKLMLSVPHMIVVFVIVLVIFGPNKLPELARGLGKLMAEFRKASTDFKSAFEEEMREMERQTRITELKKHAAAEVANANFTTEPAAEDASARIAERLEERMEPVIAPVTESVARGSSDGSESVAQSAQIEEQNHILAPVDDRDPIHDK
jgi:TatA/E family protein of Tat protein translocase